MKIVDMGRAKPKGKGKEGMVVGAWGGEEEGPRVRLDHDRMQKIGMSKPPATGDEYHVQGHARVVSSREEPRSDGGEGPVHSIEIVIHHMGAEPKASNGKQSVRDDVESATREAEGRSGGAEAKAQKTVRKPEC